jgi:hypothetical protein
VIKFVSDLWFSPGTPVSTNKTDNHDIAEILLKVTLNTMTLALFIVDRSVYMNSIFDNGQTFFYQECQAKKKLIF